MTTVRARLRSQEGTEFAALSERMLQLLLLRVSIAAMVVTWAAVRPELLGIPLLTMIAGSVAYVAASADG